MADESAARLESRCRKVSSPEGVRFTLTDRRSIFDLSRITSPSPSSSATTRVARRPPANALWVEGGHWHRQPEPPFG